MRVAQHADDVVDVVERVRRRQRQRQHLPGGELGVRETQIGVAMAVPGQLVHREEVQSRADLGLRQRVGVGVAIAAGELGIDADHVQVIRVARPRAELAADRRDAREAGKALVVARRLGGATRVVLLEAVQLPERDAGMQVGEVVLVARLDDVVAAGTLALVALPGIAVEPVQTQRAHAVGERLVAQRQHASLARGEVLVRVEREAGRIADRADLATAVDACLDRVRGVLDHGEPVLVGDRADRLHVDGMARVVDGHDRAGPRRHTGGHLGGIDAERHRIDVAEDGFRARLHDHVRGGRPGDRRRQHLVARADAEGDEREVHRGGAGGHGEGVLDAAVGGELLLELRREGPGGEPARLERAEHVRALLLAERGRREAEWCRASSRCHGEKSTAQNRPTRGPVDLRRGLSLTLAVSANRVASGSGQLPSRRRSISPIRCSGIDKGPGCRVRAPAATLVEEHGPIARRISGSVPPASTRRLLGLPPPVHEVAVADIEHSPVVRLEQRVQVDHGRRLGEQGRTPIRSTHLRARMARARHTSTRARHMLLVALLIAVVCPAVADARVHVSGRTALAAVDQLTIKGRGPMTGYDRAASATPGRT